MTPSVSGATRDGFAEPCEQWARPQCHLRPPWLYIFGAYVDDDHEGLVLKVGHDRSASEPGRATQAFEANDASRVFATRRWLFNAVAFQVLLSKLGLEL
eukprot:6475452-Amphidinium_carterae.2